jgi:hypothetical protein
LPAGGAPHGTICAGRPRAGDAGIEPLREGGDGFEVVAAGGHDQGIRPRVGHDPGAAAVEQRAENSHHFDGTGVFQFDDFDFRQGDAVDGPRFGVARPIALDADLNLLFASFPLRRAFDDRALAGDFAALGGAIPFAGGGAVLSAAGRAIAVTFAGVALLGAASRRFGRVGFAHFAGGAGALAVALRCGGLASRLILCERCAGREANCDTREQGSNVGPWNADSMNAKHGMTPMATRDRPSQGERSVPGCVWIVPQAG